MNGSDSRDPRSDEDLLSDFLAGDAAAFERLVQRYATELFGFIIRFVGSAANAEDVLQESFLQVHQSAGGFDRERRFKPWLFTIAANKARDQIRSRTRKREVSVDAIADASDSGAGGYLDVLADDAADPGDAIEADEQRRRVRGVIDDMPEHLREVLLLGYFQRLPYKEIAEVVGIPLGTVKSRLHAAVAHFATAYRRISTSEIE